MSAQLGKHYIDLSPDKCISIDSRHILLRRKSDDSYCQGRPINAIESTLTDEIVSLRESVAALTAQNAEQARQIDEAYQHIVMARDYLRTIPGFEDCELVRRYTAWLSATAPAPQDAQEKPE